MRWSFLLIGLLLISCKKEFPNAQAIVLGHAGESLIKSKSKYPPNTLESINRALEKGADGVEIDVQMTADGVLLAYHDEYLQENSDAEGCINSKTYAELQDVEIYNTHFKIVPLSDVLEDVLTANKSILLDVKHYNFCSESNIDYTIYNDAFNQLLSLYTVAQRELITVNCTNQYFLNALSDQNIKRSLESDSPLDVLPVVKSNHFDLLAIKLTCTNKAIRDSLKSNDIDLCIFNVKTRSEIYQALEFDPEVIISDNISFTKKAIDG